MFRIATLSDFDVVLNFSLQLQRLAEQSNPNVWKITQKGIENKHQSIRQLLTDEDKCIILAETTDKAIGFISGLIRTRDDYTPKLIGQIGQLYIMKTYRRRGLGTRLLKELLVFFEKHNVERILVNYIAGNKVGEAFWNNFEFKPAPSPQTCL